MSNAPDFIVHNEGDTVGVVVVEDATAGQELTGWVMASDRTIRLDGAGRRPARPQGRGQGHGQGRHGDQVRPRHRPRDRGHPGRRLRPRPQHQDQAVVSMAAHRPFSGLPARERPRRHPQPRRRPAGRRHLERRLRGRRQQHQGRDGPAARLRPAAVRRGPRPAFPHHHRHRPQPERRRLRRDRHRARMDQQGRRRDRRDRQAGARASRSSRTATSTPSPAPRARPRTSCTGRSERQREKVGIEELWAACKCGESDTTTGLASCPTRRQLLRQADPARHLRLLRRDLGADRRRRWSCAERAATPEVREKFMKVWQAYQDDVIEAQQGRRPDGQPADQGQQVRRPVDDRGEGVRQYREDRPARCATSTCSSRPRSRPRGPASTSWTRPAPRPSAAPCRRPPASSCTCSRPARAT